MIGRHKNGVGFGLDETTYTQSLYFPHRALTWRGELPAILQYYRIYNAPSYPAHKSMWSNVVEDCLRQLEQPPTPVMRLFPPRVPDAEGLRSPSPPSLLVPFFPHES